MAGNSPDQNNRGYKMFKAKKLSSAAMTSDNTSIVGDIDGEAMRASAVAMAAKEDEGMSEAMGTLIKAKEDWQGGPLKVLIAMQNAYSEEDLDAFPIPDSDTGQNPDKFKIETTDGNGKTSKKPTTWYTQFADATKEGIEISKGIEHATRAGKTDTVKTDIPANILEMNPHERTTLLNYLTGRRTTIRGAYKKAMGLYFQFKAINELTGIRAEPIWVDGKSPEDVEEGRVDEVEIETTTKPIAVWSIPEEGKPVKHWEAYSIGNFMKLDAAKAAEKGGTFKALQETNTRQTAGATGNGAEATKVPAIQTIDTLIARFAQVHSYLDHMFMAKDKKEVGQLLKLINSKEGSDELVTAIIETRNYLDDIAKDCKLDARYTKLQQEGSELITPNTNGSKVAAA